MKVADLAGSPRTAQRGVAQHTKELVYRVRLEPQASERRIRAARIARKLFHCISKECCDDATCVSNRGFAGLGRLRFRQAANGRGGGHRRDAARRVDHARRFHAPANGPETPPGRWVAVRLDALRNMAGILRIEPLPEYRARLPPNRVVAVGDKLRECAARQRRY